MPSLPQLLFLMFPFLSIFLCLVVSFIRRHSLSRSNSKRNVKLMAVLGSGGHTTEMIELLRRFDQRTYFPHVYVLAETDQFSETRVKSFEEARNGKEYEVESVPRSREVGQNYVSSVLSTLYASFFSFCVVWRHRPQLLLLNGPGTCIPIAFSAFLLDFLRISDVFVVYEESICRVQRLSLTGLILYHARFIDEFVVQWKQLKEKYPRSRLITEL